MESCINKNTIKQKQYLTEKYKTLYKWNEMKSSHPEVKHAIVRFTWTLEILLTDWKYWVQTRRLCIHNCGKIFTFLLSSTCTFYQFILLLKFWLHLKENQITYTLYLSLKLGIWISLEITLIWNFTGVTLSCRCFVSHKPWLSAVLYIKIYFCLWCVLIFLKSYYKLSICKSCLSKHMYM